ncbi:hypothetical protein B0T26DRAFT_752694 [Lasiosphaeria miniovina]|uniref:AB hydrolase-1 domain-containing protein n=1 Tax=Lasiosphaeria miniovina TaxID=1954250 RepID=A0AA40DT41_9PEZI|nr:uncharacterized protein B0T26DRAFT_752694 [Lasiosphaeria miniovina]KAK0712461.1 hypothetical protein B0T26DRAFT_752694 [Lasiosphaeria miniovina]
MRSHLSSSLLLAGTALSAVSAAAVDGRGHPTTECSNVSFKIPATAQNLVFATPPGANNETEILAFIKQSLTTGEAVSSTQRVSGDYAINAVFCQPTGKTKARGVLEVLVHGLGFDKASWGGLGFGDQYNWHAGANARGYHTLAIDRLGQGADAAHPDPRNIVQAQLHAEIIHQLITTIRKNAKNNALGQGFDKIVYVGHSFGSILGTAVGRQYPADADVTVLTGYSSAPNLGAISGYQLASAALFRPQQFAGYPLGYTMMPVEAERRANFFEGAYDPALAHFDYLTQRPSTDGEWATLAAGAGPGGGDYPGAVFVAAGVYDVGACQPPLATCQDILNKTRLAFPKARAYDFFAPDNTGHALSLHYSAPETLKRVHDFLDRHIY